MRRGLVVASGRFGAAAGRQGVAAAREAVLPAAMRAGALAQGGQRRWMAEGGKEEKKADEKEDEQKKTPPRAGPGFFQTFVNSVREQMGAASEADPKLKESHEEIERARQRSLVAAEAAMQRAKIAAEEAKKRADILEEQTRPARETTDG
ncbi:hypothetical protein T484DRAFT_1921705 [Baffinella frigidus]|nr:hypothetical protein T484DRAFT_1921705 [Cryptophyta sp. CCMP2293]